MSKHEVVNVVEKSPEALNTFSQIVSTFSHQVPGVEINFKDGKKYGLGVWWHDDGSKWVEANFKNNERHGSRTFWDKEGNITFLATYNNGESNDQNGLEPQYDEGGLIPNYIEYKDGVVVNERVENKE